MIQDFFTNYWQIIFTPLSIVIAYIFGGKQKQLTELKKSDAEAQQEETKAKRDLAGLEREIYERIVSTMQSQFDNQNKEINELKATIQLYVGNIKHLQKTVDDYKQTCDDCQFRINKKVGKAVGK
jgi:chromosome segregation ATPase